MQRKRSGPSFSVPRSVTVIVVRELGTRKFQGLLPELCPDELAFIRIKRKWRRRDCGECCWTAW